MTEDQKIITQMISIGQKYISTLNHNEACHFSIQLAGVIIGMSLANIDRATPNRIHAKEDMEKFLYLVQDEAMFYHNQEMNTSRNN